MDVILTWVWQGCLLTAVVEGTFQVWRSLNAATRHAIWGAALALTLCLPVFPELRVMRPAVIPSDLSGLAISGAMAESVSLPPEIGIIALTVWVVWVIVGLVRLAAASLVLRRARRSAAAFPEERERRLVTWSRLKAEGRPARLVLSPLVGSPCVIGLGSPIIALPPQLLDISDRELDQIVVHEHAHVQRRDDTAALAQAVIRAIAGLHPAIWWITRALSLEREVACDDWVVSHSAGPREYAACLVRIAARTSASRAWSIAPGALHSKPQLASRVHRLLESNRNTAPRRAWAPLAQMIPVLLLVSAILRVTSPPGAAELEETMAALAGRPIFEHLRVPSISGASVSARLQASTPPREQRRAVSGTLVRASVTNARGNSASAAIAGTAGDLPAIAGALAAVSGSPAAEAAALDARPLAQPATLRAAPPERVEAASSSTSPWDAAAAVGMAMGTGSRKAAVATGGFFSRLGKSVAGSFTDTDFPAR